jgi:DivIVA domain-containing protein
MIVVIVVGALILIAFAVVLSLLGDTLEPEPTDRPDLGLPADRPLTSADVPRLKFRTGLRGYRMEDVDAAFAGLTEALAIAEQRATGGSAAPPHPSQPSHPQS